MKQSVIFHIEENNDAWVGIRNLRRRNGYKVSLAIDEEDALERVSNCYLKTDLDQANQANLFSSKLSSFHPCKSHHRQRIFPTLLYRRRELNLLAFE